MRRALFLVFFAVVMVGATCKGNNTKNERPPPAPETEPDRPSRVEITEAPAAAAIPDIEGLDIGALRPELRAEYFRLLRENFCYCGCPRTIAACLSAKKDCTCVRCSERMASFILEQYKEGLTTEELEVELIDGFQEGYNGEKRELDLRDHPSKGPSDAKYVLAEFADFRCGHCRAAAGPLKQLLASNPDVRLVWFYFPLGTSADGPSVLAAEAAEEAHQQGKFWEMADLLFEHQNNLDETSLAGLAETVGLDVERFKAALSKHTHREKVLADKRLGVAAKVEATPTIFVNGRPFGLGRTLENLKLRLEMEAERGRCD